MSQTIAVRTSDDVEVVESTRRTRSELLARIAQRQGALVVLVLLSVVMAIRYPTFATGANLSQIALQSSFLAIIAVGMTLVIFTGGIDLSVGSVFALGGVLAAWGSQYGPLAGVVIPILACGLIGLIQGLVIARGGLPPFIVTLAGLLFARGLLLILTDEGSTTFKLPAESGFRALAQGKLLGLGLSVWIMAVLVVIAFVVQHRTTYGSTILAIGGQEDAARLMGLPVARTKVLTYVVSSVLAAVAGILTASYTASGVTTLGVGLELSAIAAVVLGGTLLTGGAGSVVGTLVGVLLLQLIANLINRLDLSNSNWQAVTSGTVLLAVATLQAYLKRIQKD